VEYFQVTQVLWSTIEKELLAAVSQALFVTGNTFRQPPIKSAKQVRRKSEGFWKQLFGYL
jgi:hypothetical protein